MYTRKRYSIKELLLWTRTDILVFLFIALVPIIFYEFAGWKWLHLPWLPIALIGTALAFMIGFQNNIAYDRIWEARKIWGGIVNSSRSFGLMTKDFITNENANTPVSDEQLKTYKECIFNRHMAWITALRHAMRQKRPWEIFLDRKTNREWSVRMHIPEVITTLEEDIKPLISPEELKYISKKTNKATAILSLQSKQLRELKEQGVIWKFSYLEMENMLKELFEHQGKSERIKNFPYPRQYATLNNLFVWIFIVLLPFGVVPEFSKIGEQFADSAPLISSWFVWGAIPFIIIISWIFYTLQRIGSVGENPFEGSANDVPISTISRGIEIDLREMMDEDPEMIPKPLPEKYNVQM